MQTTTTTTTLPTETNVNATETSTVDVWVVPTVKTYDDGIMLLASMWTTEKTADTLNGFRFGEVGYVTAKLRRNEVANFQSADWDDLLSTVANKTRTRQDTPIASGEVGRRIRCYVLRERIAGIAGRDVAECLSYNETRDIVGKALNFDVSSVDGSVREGWVDFYRQIHALRSGPNGRVTYEDFTNAVLATENAIATAKANTLPESERIAKAAASEVKAKATAKAKANASVTTAVNDALAKGLMSSADVLASLEGIAKQHGQEIESVSLGFDPVKATLTDVRKLVGLLFKTGNRDIMVALRDGLTKAIDSMDRGDKPADPVKASKPVKVKAPKPTPTPVPVLETAGV